jgi:hypothetical protein
MPDHNRGRTRVGDARRPCTSPGNVKSVVSQRPGLRKIAELAIHDRLLKIFRDEAPFLLRRQRSPEPDVHIAGRLPQRDDLGWR